MDQKLVPGEEEEHTGEDEWSHASDGQGWYTPPLFGREGGLQVQYVTCVLVPNWSKLDRIHSYGIARRLARTTVAAAHVSSVQKKMLSKGPDLHSMGNLFLNKPGRVIFDISVILHLCVSYFEVSLNHHSMVTLLLLTSLPPGTLVFSHSLPRSISILISYNLAGSKAYGELFGIRFFSTSFVVFPLTQI